MNLFSLVQFESYQYRSLATLGCGTNYQENTNEQ